MGEVYCAHDERLDRRVALKQIRSDVADRPGVRERFLREARAVARLDHRTVVQIFDIFEAEGCDWIVLELVEGATVAQLLEAGPLQPELGVRIALDLAAGLDAAHSEGIIHRDLKAENVVFTHKGQTKILDFGLAKQVAADGGGDPSITGTGLILGTPRAMSPEQAMALEVDHRSDLFSLGTLLYEMFTGQSPFRASNAVQTVARICTLQPPPAKSLAPATPAGLSVLIERLLEKEAARRPQTAAEVLAELQQIAEDLDLKSLASTEVPVDRESWPRSASRSGSSRLPLGSAERRKISERRWITVLSCDLVEDGEIARPLDPETLYEVMEEFQALAEASITPFAGHLARTEIGRLLVYFGYPRAHEDDARRAVLVGFALRNGVAQLSARQGSDLAVPLCLRVGIHTGPVVVVAGKDAEQVVLGQTLDLATKVQSLSVAGTVAVTDSTKEALGGVFDLEPLPGSDSTSAFFAVEENADGEATEELPLPVHSTPLVGRENELELLLGRWRRVHAGMGQLVLVLGEAGVGKTRLVESFLEAVGEGAEVLHWRSLPYYRNSAFYPVIAELKASLRLAALDTDEERLIRLEGALEGSGIAPEEGVPLLADLLSVPLGNRFEPLAISPQQRRQQLLETLMARVLSLAEQRPLLCRVEDLHWLDPSTLELLTLLIEQAPTSRLLLLCSFRPEFILPWDQLSYVTSINLGRLAGSEVELMLTNLTGGKALPAVVVEQLLEKTDGVPLFVEEMTKMVLESGLLRENNDSFELDGPLPPLAIPATLKSSLTARLDRLGSAKEVALLGAAVGREFSYQMLVSIADLEPSHLERELDRLVQAELLFRRGRSPRSRFLFKHALIQEAAYHLLAAKERGQVHGRIADALVEQEAQTVELHPELLAHHYTEAGASIKAVDLWEKAGRLAIARAANSEASSHLTRALELLEKQEASEERNRRELALRTTLGPTLMAVKGFGAPEVEQVYGRARELCFLLGEEPGLFPTVWGLCRFYISRAQYAVARPLGEQLLELAQRGESVDQRLEAHRTAGQIHFLLGELKDARRHLREGIRIYEDQLGKSGGSAMIHDPGVSCLAFVSWTLWHLGFPDRALARAEQALVQARQLTQPYNIAIAYSTLATVHILRGESAAAERQAEEEIALAIREDFAVPLASGQILRGAARVQQGRIRQGLRDLQRGLDAWNATGALANLTFSWSLLADGFHRAGDWRSGLATVDRALEFAEQQGEAFVLAELLRLRGALLFQRDGDREAALESVNEAVRVARSQGARALELRALIEASGIRGADRSAGDVAAEGGLTGDLARVLAGFSEGRETADLQAAERIAAVG